MLRTLRLTAAVVAGLAVPVFAFNVSAQTAAPIRPASPAVAPPTAPPRPTAPTAPPTATTAPPATAAPATAPAAATRRIDINGASEQELALMRGVGPVTAKAIVAGRPWDDLGDLVKKKVMAQSVYDQNKDRLALANINKSSVSDMSKTLPGVGDARARKIVDGRPYAKPDELVSKNILTQAIYDKVKDVIAY